jgi:hypothetical protein
MMGIGSRTSKTRAKAEAELLGEQARHLRDGRLADALAWPQPTLGAAIGKLARQRNDGQHG